MTVDIGSLVPLSLPEDMVRVVFPIAQDPLGDPDLPTLPALLADIDFRWNFASAPGTPVTVTYGFSAVAPTAYTPSYVTDAGSYRAFTADEMTSVEDVLEAYQAVCGITFVLADAAGAQMVCRITSTLTAVGYGNFPPASGTSGANLAQAGDFYIANTAAGQAYIAFHEIGHALGLAHAYDAYKPIPDDYGVPHGRLLSVVDQWPVPEPYYFYEVTDDNWALGQIFHPTTPMPLDILALQMIYGENTATNAGNTVYTYDVNPNFYETIWDGGGTDTIDCSNQVNPCLITLVEGSYSSIGLRDPLAGVPQYLIDFYVDGNTTDGLYSVGLFNDGSNSLAIAFNAVIENATGGSAADRLIGNTAANRLVGGGGADTLTGAAGADTLDGGGGNDRLIAGLGNDSLNGGNGNDRLIGDAGNDSMNGGTGTDNLNGGAGNDTLIWGAGDTINGATNTDTLKITVASLDLTTASNPNSRLLNIEQIDLRAGAHTLKLNTADVLAMSPTDQVKIFGDGADTVNIAGAQSAGTDLGNGFTRYTIGGATLLIDSDINVI